jgi:tyrosyl-tRNA synthetase
MDVDAKYELITRRLQEVLKGEEIRKILEEAAQPDSQRVLKLYWGASLLDSAVSLLTGKRKLF